MNASQRSFFSRPIRWFWTCALTLCAVMSWSVTEASAYNEPTHQRLTELAWGYMKTAARCSGPPAAGEETADALMECTEQCGPALTSRTEDNGGYTCGCIAQLCANECEEFEGDPLMRTQCGTQCAENARSLECGTDPECIAPGYVDPLSDDAAFEIAGACAANCYPRVHDVSPESRQDPVCRGYWSTLGTDLQNSGRFAEAVEFFQRFNGLPCPSSAEYAYRSPACERAIGGVTFSDYNAAKQLLDWDTAVYATGETMTSSSYIGCSSAGDINCYEPLPDSLFGPANFVDLSDDTSTIDLTGTILGYHSAVIDVLDDFFTEFREFPVLDEIGQNLALIVGASVGATAAPVLGLIAVSWAVLCGLTCGFDIFTGGDTCSVCWSALGSTARDLFESIEAFAETVGASSIFSSNPSTGVLGSDIPTTSSSHFMSKWWVYDDQDGYQASRAFGPLGWVGAGLTTELLGDFADVRLAYRESEKALKNYGVESSDDSMSDTRFKNVFYWTRRSYADVTMPPVDNLAYYWWHKWWEGRNTGYQEYYGLIPLGAVLHGVQDLTVPHHNHGLTTSGHVGYENDVQQRLEPLFVSVQDPNNTVTEFIYDFSDERDAALFVERVSFELNLMRQTSVVAQGVDKPVLNVRRLFHHLFERSRRDRELRHYAFEVCGNEPWQVECAENLTGDADDTYLRRMALPRAVAATVLVISEAGGGDLASYETAFDLEISSFEDETVPSLSIVDPIARPRPEPTSSSSTVSQPLSAPSEVDECLGASTRYVAAANNFANDKLTTLDFVQIHEEETLKCELQMYGLPPLPDPEVIALAEYTVGKRVALTGLFASGDIGAYETEMACLESRAAYIMDTDSGSGPVVDRCQGILDSDGDGIFDQDDACFTHPDLINAGFAVGPDGCVWNHAPVRVPELGSTIVGTRPSEVQ